MVKQRRRWGWAVAGALVLAVGIGAHRRPFDLPEPPPLPHPNGWDIAHDARGLMVYQDERYALLRDEPPYDYDAKSERAGGLSLNQVLDANLPAIARLRSALACDFVEPAWSPPGRSAFQRYAEFRELGRLLDQTADRDAARGEWDLALQHRLDGFELGLKVAGSSGEHCRDVGWVTGAVALSDGPGVVSHASGLAAAEGARRVERALATTRSLADALHRSKREGLVLWADVFSQATWRWELFHEELGWRGLPLFLTNPRTHLRQVGECYDKLVREAEKPYPQRDVTIPLAPLEDAIAGSFSMLEFISWRDARGLARGRLLTVALALRAYEADHDTLPEQLTELVPDYLKAVPTDPFTVDQPLRYRRDGESYVLYSVGPDSEDDGGEPSYVDGDPKRTYMEKDSDRDMVWGINH